MVENHQEFFETKTVEPDAIATRLRQIHTRALDESKAMDGPNFTRIHPRDLEFLFWEYDRQFYDGRMKALVADVPLHFRFSSRLTRSAGQTTMFPKREGGFRALEISVSSTILFNCFDGTDHRPITASGIVCRDRLDALQRVMEHEMTHLAENLLWGRSSCKQPRFHSMTLRFFGHTQNTHALLTPREKAHVQYGIRPGVQVRFRFDGVRHEGIVNRVNKRATVLVEAPHGQRYSDGKHYQKFYVPVRMLEVIEEV